MQLLQQFISFEMKKVGDPQHAQDQLAASMASSPGSSKQHLPEIHGGSRDPKQSNIASRDSFDKTESAKLLLEESLNQMRYHLSRGDDSTHGSRKNQLDSEIMQFERRNKLLSGIYTQNRGNS